MMGFIGSKQKRRNISSERSRFCGANIPGQINHIHVAFDAMLRNPDNFFCQLAQDLLQLVPAVI